MTFLFLPPDQWSKRYDEAFYTVKVVESKLLTEAPPTDGCVGGRSTLPAHYYQVSVYQGHQISTVWRRYSQFKWLYEQLRAESPTEPLTPGGDVIALPPGTPCPFFQPQTDEFVGIRRVELEEFLVDVLQQHGYANHPAVLTFLQL